MRRLKHSVPKHILKTIYFALINPHINYGTLLWGFNMERIVILQKKAIRIISHTYNLAHTSNLFKQFNILKVEDIFKLKQLIFYYKFTHDQLPNSIKNILVAETRILRLAHTAFFLKPPPFVNTECAKKCIRHSIPELINNFDKNFIDNFENWSLLGLKNHFKLKTLNSYEIECTTPKCYPCKTRFFNPLGFNNHMKYIHIFSYMTHFKYQKLFLPTGILEFLNIYSYTRNPH